MAEPARLGHPLIRRERVTSTMEVLADLAREGATEGTTVVADEQTAGRGRAGRSWRARPGTALLCSVLLRPTLPPERLPGLSPAVGLAVAETIERGAGLCPRLKWPNDVWLGERKVAGVLVTTRLGAAEPVVIVGIGLNVNAAADDLPPEATSLQIETGIRHDREALLMLLLDCLDDAYRRFVAAGGRLDRAAWRSRAALRGEAVSLEVAGERRGGIYFDIDEDGALLLARADGTVERVIAGELTRGPRPERGDIRQSSE